MLVNLTQPYGTQMTSKKEEYMAALTETRDPSPRYGATALETIETIFNLNCAYLILFCPLRHNNH